MRRDGDQPPLQIVPADPSVFRGAVPASPSPQPSRRPRWAALLVGALVVALVFTMGHRGKGSAVPATTSSSSSTSSTSTSVAEVAQQRPPQIGVEAPAVASVPFRLVLEPSTARVGDFVTVSAAGDLSGGAPTPLLLTIDDQIGGFWRTLAWYVGALPGSGPFLSGVVLGNGTIPPHDVPLPAASPVDPFQVQVEGLTAGDYRVCRRFVVLGATIGDYVCATLTVIP